MRLRSAASSIALVFSFALGACGGATPAASPPPGDPAGTGAEATPEPAGCCCHYLKETLVDDDYVESYEHDTMSEAACSEESESECVDVSECEGGGGDDD